MHTLEKSIWEGENGHTMREWLAKTSEPLIGAYFFLGLMPFSGVPAVAKATSAILVIAALLMMMSTSDPRGLTKVSSSLGLAIIAFLCSILLSTLFSSAPARSAEMLAMPVAGLLVCALTAFTSRPYFLIKTYCYANLLTLLTLTGTLLFLRLFDAQTAPTEQLGQLSISFFRVPNDVLYFFLSWPLFHWAANHQFVGAILSRQLLVLSYPVCLLVLATLLQSRSAFLLTAVTLLIYAFLGARERRRVSYILLTSGAIAALILASPAFMEKLTDIFSSSQRLWIWYVSAQMVPASDYWIGVGHGLFDVTFEMARTQAEWPPYLTEDPRRIGWAHNLFLEAWVERGFIGFAALAFLLLRLRRELINRSANIGPRKAALAALTLFAVTSCFELTFARLWVWLTLGLLAGLALNNVAPKPSTESTG